METREVNFPPCALLYLTCCQFQLWMAGKEDEEGCRTGVVFTSSQVQLLIPKQECASFRQENATGSSPSRPGWFRTVVLPNQMVVPTIRSQGVQ